MDEKPNYSVSDKESDGFVLPNETPLYNAHVDVSGIDEKKLIRKVDITLIPWLSLLYLLSFLDRASIGNAKLYNLEGDLGITDKQYLISLTVFFFSYAAFEVPSNVFLKRLRPSIWLSILILFWGVTMVVQGLVHDYASLVTVRWFLGMFEAGLFPGVSYLLSCWYKRSEFGIRMAVFFSATTASGAFGGLLAAAISKMDDIGGKPGWAWIFILEGLATVVAGVASFWLVQDFPDTAKFLSEAERTVIIRRLQGDDQFSAAGEEFRWKYIRQSLLDWKTYVGTWYAIKSPGSELLNWVVHIATGFRATPANLLTVPVYVCACVIMCLVGFLADRYGRRGLFNIGFMCLSVSGYIILILSKSAALSYFAVYLAACGIYPVLPNNVVWMSNNVEGSYKRSVALGMIFSFANINGAVSSNIYRQTDQPRYVLGHGLVLMYLGFGLVSTTVYFILTKRENEKRERGERDEVIKGQSGGNEKNGTFESVVEAKREKGDEWSGYRYVL